MRVRTLFLQSAAAAALGSFPQQAMAQLDEIVVTAQKREQDILDVPISLSVIGGDELRSEQISSTQDIANSLPNVLVSEGNISNNIYVRGVGSGSSAGFEQAVPTFVDGVYHGRSRYTQSSLVDVERVEVLRGPQTIYFGNNAIGGAFSVTTASPTLTNWEGYAQASYEFIGQEPIVEAAVGGPVINDKLGIRVAGRYSNLDGYIDNVATNRTDPGIEDRYVRFSALADMGSGWSGYFKADYGKQDSVAPYAQQLQNCPTPAPFPSTAACDLAVNVLGLETDFDFNRAGIDGELGEIEAYELVGRIERDNFNGIGITAQVSLSNQDYNIAAGSGLGVPYISFSQPETLDQKTAEFRITSPADSKLQYILGAYYLDSEMYINTNFILSFLTPVIQGTPAFAPLAQFDGAFGIRHDQTQKEEAYSFFGSVTYPVTDRLSLTAGLRYINSQKSGVHTAANVYSQGCCGLVNSPYPAGLQPLAAALSGTQAFTISGDVNDDDWLPSVSANYEATPNMVFYAKYSEGFKAGGYDPGIAFPDVAAWTFAPETVKAYEAGMKSELFNQTLRFNLSIFHSDYKDLQQGVIQVSGNAANIQISNVGALRSRGVEADFLWQPDRNWQIGGALAYLDAKYKDFPNAGCTALQQVQYTGTGSCTQDVSGRSPPFAPEFSGYFQAKYTYPIYDNIDLGLMSRVNFNSSYDLQPDKDPFQRQSAWQKVDMRISVSDVEERWEVALLGKNVFNEKVMGSATDLVASPGAFIATIERGRQIVLQFRTTWN